MDGETKMTINLPERVSFILECLSLSGYAAYVVGGCVRDSVLGIAPHDWDICTSARPEETMEVFKQIGWGVVETGVKYGTVTVIAKNSYEPDEPFEITTFRIDGEYKDNRRPEDVTFTDDLVADLSRRDFTINAMAYHPAYGLIDPFGGLDDIKQKYIRCVGDPQKRFEEDALRMLRAVRFALRYDYRIEYNTMLAIHQMEENVQNVSVERVSSEFTRILSETFFPEKSNDDPVFQQFLRFASMFNPFQSMDSVSSLSFCNNDIETSLAVLCDSPEMEQKLLDLRFPKYVAKNAAEIYRIGMLILVNLDFQKATGRHFRYLARQIISRVGAHFNCIYIARYGVRFAMANCDPKLLPFLFRLEKQIIRVAEEDIPCRVSELAVNGNDIMKFGCKGAEVGSVLNHLLGKVMAEELKNDRDSLIGYLKSINDFPTWSRFLCSTKKN